MISVAMTTYNGERFIEEQLRSILSQSLPVDEIIICDDRSSDRTVEIINTLKNGKIKVIQNPQNVGYIENFYKAISLTQGDYIFLADQDDIWDKEKVKTSIEWIRKTNAMAVCTNFSLIDANEKNIEDDSNLSINPFIRQFKGEIADITTIRLAFGNVAQGCTYCFTKSVKEIYLKIHNTEVIHDLQILIIASCMGDVKFINEKLIKYRIHENNSIGFEKKGRKINLPNKRISREPFMYRFFRQVNETVPVNKLWVYRILYYCRIPYIRSLFVR